MIMYGMVPEPGTWALVPLGLAVIAGRTLARRRAAARDEVVRSRRRSRARGANGERVLQAASGIGAVVPGRGGQGGSQDDGEQYLTPD